MMVLSGLLNKSSTEQSPRNSKRAQPSSSSPKDKARPSLGGPSSKETTTYLFEESQLQSTESEDPDLRDLNNSLVVLASIFPDVQIEVFREMLSSFNEDSRLAVVTETLLKHKMQWVKGRYRVVGQENTQTVEGKARSLESTDRVPLEERFRSTEYKQAVKAVMHNEFKGLSKSTINAVLAEHNYSYNLARPTLISLCSKSWRFSISSILFRRKPITSSDAQSHPLVVWQSTGHGSIIPSLKSTGSSDLDKELFQSLIVPFQKNCLAERELKDHALALELNALEAEEQGLLHDCECCFTSSTFEQLSACNEGDHFICYRCIRHAINEAVFGQGWSRNVDVKLGSLRCLAPTSTVCEGSISYDLICRAFIDEKCGEDILSKLDERLAEDSLIKTQLPLIRCPFCSYAEIDELYLPEPHRSWQIRRNQHFSYYAIPALIIGVGMVSFFLPVFLLVSFIFLLASCHQTFLDIVIEQFTSSVTRMRRRQHGLKFTCQNPKCGRSSCMSCTKAWTDIHICHESSLLALRTQVELAMSLAIKRTCPHCNTSFVKSSGCNKLTCVCGYQMCYVCRKDIGNGEGYRHFCEHFRPNGGRGCTECSKCDLYRCEDEEIVVKNAKEEAERQWLEKEGKSVEDNEDVRKGLIQKLYPQSGRGWHLGLPGWEYILDTVVEAVIE